MYTEEEIDSVRREFFRPLSVLEEGYFCDFYRLILKDGSNVFRIVASTHT